MLLWGRFLRVPLGSSVSDISIRLDRSIRTPEYLPDALLELTSRPLPITSSRHTNPKSSPRLDVHDSRGEQLHHNSRPQCNRCIGHGLYRTLHQEVYNQDLTADLHTIPKPPTMFSYLPVGDSMFKDIIGGSSFRSKPNGIVIERKLRCRPNNALRDTVAKLQVNSQRIRRTTHLNHCRASPSELMQDRLTNDAIQSSSKNTCV